MTPMRNSPPKNDELELSVFGPGIGECLVVHLGNGDWMIVDSCMDSSIEQPAPVALDYLQQLNVNIATQVKMIVATHWHDDHIQGLSEIVSRAETAEFACAESLGQDEFFTLVKSNSESTLVVLTSGVAEFGSILETLRSRKRKKSPSAKYGGPDRWVSEDKVLYEVGGANPVEVTALSPSAATHTRALLALKTLLPFPCSLRKRVPAPTPNDTSIVLRIKTPGLNMLLGADLQVDNDPLCGWHAVFAATSKRPPVLSSVLKVAHHGSDNGDHESIWANLLCAKPYALLTPYAAGRKPRPADEDVKRIKKQTPHVYCTRWPPTKKPERRDGDGIMNDFVESRREIPKQPGHIRLRVPMHGKCSDVQISLFNGAQKL